jgi:hypothetical protein
LFEVLLITSAIIIIIVIIVVVVFLVSLVVLVYMLAPFILYKVHREVLGYLSIYKVTCREELRACGFALVISVLS